MTLIFAAGDTWSGWDIDKHGIQIDFVDSHGGRRSATYATSRTLLCVLCRHHIEFLRQIFTGRRSRAEVDQAAGTSPCFLHREPADRYALQRQAIDSLIKKSGSKDSTSSATLLIPSSQARLTVTHSKSDRLFARAFGSDESHALSKREGAICCCSPFET